MNPKDFEIIFGVEIPSFDGCFGKGQDGMTVKQRTLIHNLGLNVAGVKYKAQASVIISTVLERNGRGLATIKQVQTIRNLGLKTKQPLRSITRKEATELLSKILL
jgi:hypothetical protein